MISSVSGSVSIYNRVIVRVCVCVCNSVLIVEVSIIVYIAFDLPFYLDLLNNTFYSKIFKYILIVQQTKFDSLQFVCLITMKNT